VLQSGEAIVTQAVIRLPCKPSIHARPGDSLTHTITAVLNLVTVRPLKSINHCYCALISIRWKRMWGLEIQLRASSPSVLDELEAPACFLYKRCSTADHLTTLNCLQRHLLLRSPEQWPAAVTSHRFPIIVYARRGRRPHLSAQPGRRPT